MSVACKKQLMQQLARRTATQSLSLLQIAAVPQGFVIGPLLFHHQEAAFTF